MDRTGILKATLTCLSSYSSSTFKLILSPPQTFSPPHLPLTPPHPLSSPLMSSSPRSLPTSPLISFSLCCLLSLLTSSNAIVQNLSKDPVTHVYPYDPTVSFWRRKTSRVKYGTKLEKSVSQQMHVCFKFINSLTSLPPTESSISFRNLKTHNRFNNNLPPTFS